MYCGWELVKSTTMMKNCGKGQTNTHTDKGVFGGNRDVSHSKYRADYEDTDLFRTMSMLDCIFS